MAIVYYCEATGEKVDVTDYVDKLDSITRIFKDEKTRDAHLLKETSLRKTIAHINTIKTHKIKPISKIVDFRYKKNKAKRYGIKTPILVRRSHEAPFSYVMEVGELEYAIALSLKEDLVPISVLDITVLDGAVSLIRQIRDEKLNCIEKGAVLEKLVDFGTIDLISGHRRRYKHQEVADLCGMARSTVFDHIVLYKHAIPEIINGVLLKKFGQRAAAKLATQKPEIQKLYYPKLSKMGYHGFCDFVKSIPMFEKRVLMLENRATTKPMMFRFCNRHIPKSHLENVYATLRHFEGNYDINKKSFEDGVIQGIQYAFGLISTIKERQE